MPPLLVAWVIDSVRGEAPSWIKTLIPSQDPWNMAVFLACLAILIFGLESFFQWLYQKGFKTLAQHVQHSLRIDTYDHLQRRELAFFEEHRLGNTLSILNDDVNQMERFMNTGFNEILQLGVVFIFSGVVLFSTSWQLALFSLTPIPVIILGSLWYQKKIAPKYLTVRNTVGELSNRLENNIAGISVIKSFTAEHFEKDRVASASDDYKQANIAAIKWNALCPLYTHSDCRWFCRRFINGELLDFEWIHLFNRW